MVVVVVVAVAMVVVSDQLRRPRSLSREYVAKLRLSKDCGSSRLQCSSEISGSERVLPFFSPLSLSSSFSLLLLLSPFFLEHLSLLSCSSCSVFHRRSHFSYFFLARLLSALPLVPSCVPCTLVRAEPHPRPSLERPISRRLVRTCLAHSARDRLVTVDRTPDRLMDTCGETCRTLTGDPWRYLIVRDVPRGSATVTPVNGARLVGVARRAVGRARSA